MRNAQYFKEKNITIIGLARSGFACANLLHLLGAHVWVTEIKDNAQTRDSAQALEAKGIRVELGRHSKDFISRAEIIVLSPGIPGNVEPLIWASELSKPVYAEIEIASILCPAPIIAVTGSNGKTTVTTLIGKVLEASGKKVFVCGNIGNPFCAEVEKVGKRDFVVLEVSSFQLETIRDFKPKIALILNLTANHLDRYRNLQEYLAAKKRIFLNQDKEDFLVLNRDDPLLKDLTKEAASRSVFFDHQPGINPNQSAVLKVGEVLGLDKSKMLGVFAQFKGIEHRLEEVVEISQVKFINDSKATTADSAIWAINSISTPIILIAGGRHKGINYQVIAGAAKNKVKQAVLIGEAKERIAADLKGVFPFQMADSLEEAVNKAYVSAKEGDSVLFSPMCSSFDMFKDYEERGRVFKKIVRELERKHNSHG